MKAFIYILLALFTVSSFNASAQCKKRKQTVNRDTVVLNLQAAGFSFSFDFTQGKKHNHPSFAIWIEDLEGNLIQPLFVTKAFGTGVYEFGSKESGNWVPGARRYEATLPYFVHKWSNSFDGHELHIPNETLPVADAYTGATPEASFTLNTHSKDLLDKPFKVLIEFNQPWDVNEFWNNAKYPGDRDYKASCQPSLIYAVTVDPNDIMDMYYFNPIGHGHYSGKDGRLYTDLSTMSTAFEIFDKIVMKIQ
jgi:hypothetical protein